MKTIKILFFVIFVNLLFNACATSKITYDYDDAIDFSLYKLLYYRKTQPYI